MPPNRTPTRTPIVSALAANGIGTTVNVRDFKNVMMQLSTASNADMTIKIQGSLQELAPTFSSSASGTNHWDFIGVYDLNGGGFVAGSTGFAPGGVDIVKNLLVNVDGINWLNIVVSNYVAGNMSATAVMYTNQ